MEFTLGNYFWLEKISVFLFLPSAFSNLKCKSAGIMVFIAV